MKKLSISIMLVILLFTLAGCGYGEYKGNVIDKKYIPSKTIMTPMHIGKTMYVMPIYYSEKYEIKIEKEENSEIKNTWLTVSKEQYENISIGDCWED